MKLRRNGFPSSDRLNAGALSMLKDTIALSEPNDEPSGESAYREHEKCSRTPWLLIFGLFAASLSPAVAAFEACPSRPSGEAMLANTVKVLERVPAHFESQREFRDDLWLELASGLVSLERIDHAVQLVPSITSRSKRLRITEKISEAAVERGDRETAEMLAQRALDMLERRATRERIDGYRGLVRTFSGKGFPSIVQQIDSQLVAVAIADSAARRSDDLSGRLEDRLQILSESAARLAGEGLLSQAQQRLSACQDIPAQLISRPDSRVPYLTRVAALEFELKGLPAAIEVVEEIREPSERALMLARLAETLARISPETSRAALMQRIRDAVARTNLLVRSTAREPSYYHQPSLVLLDVATVQSRLGDDTGAAATLARVNALADRIVWNSRRRSRVLDHALLELYMKEHESRSARGIPSTATADEVLKGIAMRLGTFYAHAEYCDPEPEQCRLHFISREARRQARCPRELTACTNDVGHTAALIAIAGSPERGYEFIGRTRFPQEQYEQLAAASALALAERGHLGLARELRNQFGRPEQFTSMTANVEIGGNSPLSLEELAELVGSETKLVTTVERAAVALLDAGRDAQSDALVAAASNRFSASSSAAVQYAGALFTIKFLSLRGRSEEAKSLWEDTREQYRKNMSNRSDDRLVGAALSIDRVDDLFNLVAGPDEQTAGSNSEGVAKAPVIVAKAPVMVSSNPRLAELLVKSLSPRTDLDLAAQFEKIHRHVDDKSFGLVLDYLIARGEIDRAKRMLRDFHSGWKNDYTAKVATAIADSDSPDEAISLWRSFNAKFVPQAVLEHVGAAYVRSGQLDKARSMLKAAKSSDMRFGVTVALIVDAYESGQPELGQSLGDEIASMTLYSSWPRWFDLAEKLASAGWPGPAERFLDLGLDAMWAKERSMAYSGAAHDALAKAKVRVLTARGRHDDALAIADSIREPGTRRITKDEVLAAHPTPRGAHEHEAAPTPTDSRLRIKALLSDVGSENLQTDRSKVAEAMVLAIESQCAPYVLQVLPEFARVGQSEAAIVWLENLTEYRDSEWLKALADMASLQIGLGQPGSVAVTLGWAEDIIADRAPALEDRDRAEKIVENIAARIDSNAEKPRCMRSFRWVDLDSPSSAPLLDLAKVAVAIDDPRAVLFLATAEAHALAADEEASRQLLLGELAVKETRANFTPRACARLETLTMERVRIEQMIQVTLATLRREQDEAR